jgi:hypothetical protein
MADLMSVLVNLSSQIAPIIMLMQTFAGLMGLYFVASALIEFWGIDNPNASKYVSGKNNFSAMGGIVKLMLGGVMASMSTLQLVGIMSRTMTDEYANSRFLSYAPNGSSFDEQKLAALAAILGIMQIVGFAAMFKGWLTVKRSFEGQSQNSLGMAFTWLIGGIIAWNFKYFSDVANCSFGFNVIGIFVPYGTQNACS